MLGNASGSDIPVSGDAAWLHRRQAGQSWVLQRRSHGAWTSLLGDLGPRFDGAGWTPATANVGRRRQAYRRRSRPVGHHGAGADHGVLANGHTLPDRGRADPDVAFALTGVLLNWRECNLRGVAGVIGWWTAWGVDSGGANVVQRDWPARPSSTASEGLARESVEEAYIRSGAVWGSRRVWRRR